MSQNLDIIQAFNDPASRIRILLGRDIVTASVINDTTLSPSVQWNDPMEQLLENAKNGLTGLLGDTAQSVVNIARRVSPISATPLQATIKQWVNTGGPTLALRLLFVATDSSVDVRKGINTIMKYVWPTNNGGLMVPPGGYKNIGYIGGGANSSTIPDGVITVEIGRWFSAKQILIITGSPSPTYSKECIDTTFRPLWATLDVTFVPYRALTIDDWNSMFV